MGAVCGAVAGLVFAFFCMGLVGLVLLVSLPFFRACSGVLCMRSLLSMRHAFYLSFAAGVMTWMNMQSS